MGIRNFYSWLIVINLFFLSGCQIFQEKQRTGQETPQRPGVVEEEEPDGVEPPQVEKPEFLQKQPPKVGLILGGGGAMAYAHIGILQELEKQKVPVVAIGGVEWGALVASAYALNKKAHGVEWALLKMPVDNFMSSGFFSSGRSAVAVNKFSGFLSSIYKKKSINDTAIPFTCTFLDLKRQKAGPYRRGRLVNAMNACWPYPPHFKVGNASANLNGVGEIAQFLKSKGAQLIVYLDVVGQNQLLSAKEAGKSPGELLPWVENRSLVQALHMGWVHEVIQIPLPGQQMTSYKNLRAIIRSGQLKGKSQVQELVRKYDY